MKRFLDELINALSHYRRGRSVAAVTPTGFAERLRRAVAREEQK